jgi:hypothetical protein
MQGKEPNGDVWHPRDVLGALGHKDFG